MGKRTAYHAGVLCRLKTLGEWAPALPYVPSSWAKDEDLSRAYLKGFHAAQDALARQGATVIHLSLYSRIPLGVGRVWVASWMPRLVQLSVKDKDGEEYVCRFALRQGQEDPYPLLNETLEKISDKLTRAASD